MFEPGILIFEKQRRWTPELQRQFDGEPVQVRMCPSLAALREAIHEATNVAIVLLDLEAAPADCLQFLGRMPVGRRWPVVVIGSPRTADLEWAVRELGALEYTSSIVSGSRMAQLCRRQLARFAPSPSPRGTALSLRSGSATTQ